MLVFHGTDRDGAAGYRYPAAKKFVTLLPDGGFHHEYFIFYNWWKNRMGWVVHQGWDDAGIVGKNRKKGAADIRKSVFRQTQGRESGHRLPRR